MNQTFSFSRWWWLVQKHWSENARKYTLTLIAMAGLLLVWFGFLILMDRYHPLSKDMQAVVFYSGLGIVGCLFAGSFFGELSSKPKTIYYLSVPASHLEKLASALFYVVVVFIVSYTLIFYLVDIPMVKVANALSYQRWLNEYPTLAEQQQHVFKPDEIINLFSTERYEFPHYYAFLIFLPVQALFLLGSVYFERFAFIKTAIAGLLIITFFVFFMKFSNDTILPNESGLYDSIIRIKVWDLGPGKIVTLPGWLDTALHFIAKFAFAPIFWVISWFRLKEKEV
jgi:hypothetical protein